MFSRQDANGDGKLAGEELTGRWRDGLEQNDTNKDGALTLEEFRAGMRNMFQRGQRGGGGGGGGYRGGGGQDRPDRPNRPTVASDDA
jgi:hypothetical protein